MANLPSLSFDSNQHEAHRAFSLGLGPGGFQLISMEDGQTFGPTENPLALGTVVAALSLSVSYNSDDELVRDFASELWGWANALSRLIAGDLRPAISGGCGIPDIDRWADQAAAVSHDSALAKRVGHQVRWLLYPVAAQLERSNRSMAQRDWIRRCLVVSDVYIEEAVALRAQDHGILAASPTILAGYHLLRGAALVMNPPDEEAGAPMDGPDDVQPGFVELGLPLSIQAETRRFLYWEAFGRYQAGLLEFTPDLADCLAWTSNLRDRYVTRLGPISPLHLIEVLGERKRRADKLGKEAP